jgi:hypothetical protein
MKAKCEKCDTDLALVGIAHICSFECTFCASCAAGMDHVCPNCGGELVRRPTRTRSPAAVASGQLIGRIQRLFS